MSFLPSLLLFWIASVAAAQTRRNGILYDHGGAEMRLFDLPEQMLSHGFPNNAPHDLIQTWKWVGKQEPGKNTAIKIICYKVYIPKMPGRGDCGNYALTYKDGNRVHKLCGDVERFLLISETNEITFEMQTGKEGGGVVSCTAEAVLVTDDREEITTTTTTPEPIKLTYLSMESEEVDSSEHGIVKGKKSTTCQCGWSNKVRSFSRIVNGTEASRNEFPFAASIGYRNTRTKACGSTIITRYHALTAAHCTDKHYAKDLALFVGVHNMDRDWSGPMDEINIESIIQHPQYETGIWSKDIAILVMEREIKFSQFVGPACLPPASPPINKLLDRKYIKIVGWGAEVFMGFGTPELRKVDVRVVPMEECNYEYYHVNVTNPTQICTYATHKSSCQGDSGGPVIWVDPETNRYTHVGIVSFARVCGDTAPSVHSSVQAYLGWIHHHVKATNKPNSETCTKID